MDENRLVWQAAQVDTMMEMFERSFLHIMDRDGRVEMEERDRSTTAWYTLRALTKDLMDTINQSSEKRSV